MEAREVDLKDRGREQEKERERERMVVGEREKEIDGENPLPHVSAWLINYL